MIGRTGFALAALLLATLLVAPAIVDARSCSTSDDCDPGGTCAVTSDFFLFKVRECQGATCKVDGDCTGGTLCLLGQCAAGCRTELDCPTTSVCIHATCVAPTASTDARPNPERKCIPPDGSRAPGWAADRRGQPLGPCPQGTYCSNRGFCVAPPR